MVEPAEAGKIANLCFRALSALRSVYDVVPFPSGAEHIQPTLDAIDHSLWVLHEKTKKEVVVLELVASDGSVLISTELIVGTNIGVSLDVSPVFKRWAQEISRGSS